MRDNISKYPINTKGGITINYNLAAEYASLLIVTIGMIGLVVERNVIAVRYRGLKWMYYITFSAVVITIVSITITDNHADYPLWVSDFWRAMYFIASPILAMFYLFYAISIIYIKLSPSQLVRKFFWIPIPYLAYTLFIATNPLHRLVFSITAEEGYVKGIVSQASYYIAFIYFALLVVFTIIHIKTPQKNVLVVICLNFLNSIFVFSLQIIMPYVQLSGLACVSGLLIVHLYVLSVSKMVDSLTELNNKQTLNVHLNKLCENKTPFSLVVFSLRNFKSINERFGLEFGDELLLDLALRFRVLLPSRHLYRYSGDEFAYLQINPDNSFNNLLKFVMGRVCKSFDSGVNNVTIDMVYARIDYPEFGLNVKEMISSMDYSISSVKKNSGETNFFYDPSICDKMKRRNHIVERLKQAITNDEFEVYYQPIYSSKERKFPLAEALIRLKPTDGEFISPGEFIPIAEEVGLVSKLTYIVLEKVCKDFRYLLDLYGDKLQLKSVSINFPYVHFLTKSTVDEVMRIVDRYQISHDKIKMELTERTLVADTTTAEGIMDEFIARGFEFELDDFGVEYSNLSLFFDIPIKIIKFDRSLVLSSTANETRRVFFEHLLKSIKALGKQVVMEGVEGEELLRYLIACDCDYIQGYVFSRPLPLEEFSEFMSK